MHRILITSALALLLVPVVFAVNPVTVDDGGGADFTRVMAAIASFASGEANAGETPPFIINIAGGSGPYQEVIHFDEEVIVADPGTVEATAIILAGDMTVQSASPGVLVELRVESSEPWVTNSSDDCISIALSDVNLTLIDLLIIPAQTGANIDDIIKIDEPFANATLNTITFQDCVVSDIASPSGAALVTTKAGALIDPAGAGSRPVSTTTGFESAVQMWADGGESSSAVYTDTVIYACAWGGGNVLRQNLVGGAGGPESVTITDCVFSYNPGNGEVIRAGTGGSVAGSTFTVAGTGDSDAGPLNGTVILTPGGGDDVFSFENALDWTISIDETIIADNRGGGTSIGLDVSGSGIPSLSISDTMIFADGTGLRINPGESTTITRTTIHTTNAALAVSVSAGEASDELTITDSILSGGSTAAIGGATPAGAGGLSVSFCGIPLFGPAANAAQDDGVIVGTFSNISDADPGYKSLDPTSADFLDVGSEQYGGAATAAADLAGGGTFIGDVFTVPVEIAVFETE